MKKIFVFLLLICLNYCQYGGHSSGGGSSSHSSGYSRSSGGKSSCDSTCNGIIIGVVCGVIAIVIIAIALAIWYCQHKKNSLDQMNKLNLLQTFINTDNNKDEEQLQQLQKKVIEQSWKMEYIQEKNYQNMEIKNLDVQIVLQNELNKNPYLKIDLECSDTYGQSQLEGAIICSEQSSKIFMFKDYEDKSKAGQRGNYSILIYEGLSKNIDDGFDGRWYYYYHHQSSGSWMWKS